MLLLAAVAAVHSPRLGAPPNGFHLWREADTAQIAERFTEAGAEPARPKVFHLGAADGVAGSELPVYTWVVSRLYAAFGFAHHWPRGLSLAAALAVVALVRALAVALGLSARAAFLAAFAAGFSPLLVFYGSKIQPDVLGLAAALGGLLAFHRHLTGGRRRAAVAAALLLAVAGGIKPTLLGVGLPMAILLWRQGGPRAFAKPGPWLVAAVALAVPALWLAHATRLNAERGDSYFYLGGDWLAELAGVTKASFYQNVLLTWPFELSPAGLALAAVLLAGAAPKLAGTWSVLATWLAAGLITCVMAAEHCATPHDYYFLPLVPPLAILAGAALDGALRTRRAGLAFLLLAVFPTYGVLRVAGRHEETPDFAAARAAIASAGLARERVVALDVIPGDLLYRAGMRGWQLDPAAAPEKLAAYRARGARLAVVSAKLAPRAASLTASSKPPVLVTEGLAFYEIDGAVAE